MAGVDPKAGLDDRLSVFVIAALLALGPALTNLPEGWNRWWLAIGFTAQGTNGQVIGKTGKTLWQRILLGLASGGAYLAWWYRRLRGQALPVFLLFACWLLLFFGLYAYFEPRGGYAWLTRLGEAEEGSPIFTAGQLIFPLLWVLFLWIAFRLLDGLAWLNEVFCFNTAWRSTVHRLMHLSDVIVLDLRGLTAQREGTGYEIRLLAREALLEKVLAVADDATDWAHVESPLRADEGADPGRLRRLSIGKEPQSQELFTKLLQIAGRPPSA